MVSKTKIRNNIFFISFGQVISFLLNIITFGIVARVLEVEAFGKFNYALAIIGFSAKIIDLGLNPIILRETTKNKNYNEYVGSAFYLKTTLIGLFFVILNVYLWLDNIGIEEKVLFNLFTLNIFFSGKYTNIRELLITPYKATINMNIPMLLILLDSVLLLGFTALLRANRYALIQFTVIYVASNIPSTFILLYLLKAKQKIKFVFNSGVLLKVIKMSLPVYGYVILMIIFGQSDIILLRTINNNYAVGLYSSAVRLTNPFIIFASAITSTFFPIIVKKKEDRQNIDANISFIVSLLIMLSFIIFIFLFFHSQEIILLVFGSKFLFASKALRFLSVSLIFSFLNFFLIDLFTAVGKQKLNFVYGILLNLISLPAYIFVLPVYSYVGAGAVKLISVVVGTIFLVLFLLRFVKLKISLLRFMGWALANLAFFYLFDTGNLILSLFIEFIFILFTILVFKLLSKEEWEMIFKAMNQEKLFSKLKGFF